MNAKRWSELKPYKVIVIKKNGTVLTYTNPEYEYKNKTYIVSGEVGGRFRQDRFSEIEVERVNVYLC